jgi:biopolymer transport protein ExbB/TolQ
MRILWFHLLAVLAGCGGGISSHEDVIDARMEANEDLAKLLEDVTDKQSALAARPKLEAINRRMREIEAAEAKLGEPNEADFKRAMEKWEEWSRKHQARMQRIFERIFSDPEILEALGEVPRR